MGLRIPGRRFCTGVRNAVAVTILTTLSAALALMISASHSMVAIAGANPIRAAGSAPAVVEAGAVRAEIVLSSSRSSAGRQLGVAVEFNVAPGWHIYGEPLPEGEGLTPTAIKFDSDLVSEQKLILPKPTPLRFEALNETLPVYQGNFKAAGSVLLKQKLAAGDYKIAGTLNFQECNEGICKMPQSLRFEVPITIEPIAASAPKSKT